MPARYCQGFRSPHSKSRLIPQRGAYTRELLALGIREYREIFFKPYRIIYRVVGKRVYVFLIADGRRDLQKVLQQRLLNG